MSVAIDSLPDDVDALKRLVQQKQSLIDRHRDTISAKQTVIERLEELLRHYQHERFGARSEKHPGQGELQFFNEAELLQAQAADDADTIAVPAHRRKRATSRGLPAALPRVDVVHDLAHDDKTCTCGKPLRHIDDEVSEQLAIIPQQHFVIRHLRRKYACACKACIKAAPMPKQPLPGSQASAQLLSHVMVSKYLDGLPLYRQEKIAARSGLELPRAKLARWLIDSATLFQPLYNLFQDAFFSYDIALSDETGIQVLKEDGRRAENKSYLWIRRGGPPDKPVVLVDYSPSKSGETAYGLLSECRGYLVCDAASNFNLSVRRNALKPVHCNDHARRKFTEVLTGLDKKQRSKGWTAKKAIDFYKALYRLERDIASLSPDDKQLKRQEKAIPIWDEFLDWAQHVLDSGIAHRGTREALGYLLGHAEGLRRYCDDGRLPISNIQSEHVAKTIALARKNFLFADTPAGAASSATIYSMLETARANGHNPHHYLSVVLTELPQASSLAELEALLPWNLTPDDAKQRYDALPAP